MNTLIYSPVSETLAGPIGSDLLGEEGLNSIDPHRKEELRQFYVQHNAFCFAKRRKWGSLWRECAVCYELSNLIVLHHGLDFFLY